MSFLKRIYLLVGVVAILVNIGWIADIEVLKSVIAGMETMKPLTAICFLLSVVSIYFNKVVSIVTAPFVFLVAGIQIVEASFNTLFFPVSDPLSLRMSPATALLFMAFSVVVFLYGMRRSRQAQKAIEVVCLFALFVCFVDLLGYLLDYEAVYSVGFFSSMALHTALCFAALFFTMLLELSYDRYSWFHLVHSENLGGSVVLRRWLVTLLVPALVSALILVGARFDFYQLEFGFILLAAFSSAFTTFFLLRKARVIEKIDIENKGLLYQKEKVNDDLQILNEALSASQKELETKNKELVQAVEELYRRNKELDMFTYHTSHDIRSPVASILGLLQVASMEDDIHKLKGYLKAIENRSKRLDKFIHQMVMFTRNDRSALNLEPISIAQFIKECVGDLRGSPDIETLKIETKVDLENPVFVADRIRLKEIFNNIFENAVKFRNVYAEQCLLKINVTSVGGLVRISFEDNGIGIRKEFLPRMFQMFQRANDRVEGSGLGLYIVKQMVTKLWGDVRLTSEVGVGTTIEIDLPLHTEASGRSAQI